MSVPGANTWSLTAHSRSASSAGGAFTWFNLLPSRFPDFWSQRESRRPSNDYTSVYTGVQTSEDRDGAGERNCPTVVGARRDVGRHDDRVPRRHRREHCAPTHLTR